MGRAHDAALASRKRAAIELVQRHERTLRRTARRYSLCADDAEDALQRALEILLTKAPTSDQRELIRWMQTVTKHEALAVRRNRERSLGTPASSGRDQDADWVQLIPSEKDGPADAAERRERIGRAREALKALKPQELRALTLLAQGYSYAEIGEVTGWTYTKVNRCLAEGRQRFRAVLSSIEEGRRCEELAPTLSAFVDGEANARLTEQLLTHLKECGLCRAKVRSYRAAPRAAAALAPTLPAARSLTERLHDPGWCCAVPATEPNRCRRLRCQSVRCSWRNARKRNGVGGQAPHGLCRHSWWRGRVRGRRGSPSRPHRIARRQLAHRTGCRRVRAISIRQWDSDGHPDSDATGDGSGFESACKHTAGGHGPNAVTSSYGHTRVQPRGTRGSRALSAQEDRVRSRLKQRWDRRRITCPLKWGVRTMRAARVNRRRAVRVCALSALGAALLLAGPMAAKTFGGTYVATECAASNTYSQAQYFESGHHMLLATRDCGVGGGGLSISLPQAYWSGYGSEARFQLGVPAGVHFTNVSGAQQGVDADGWHVAVHACSPSACTANVYVSGDGYWRIFGTPTGNYTNWFTRLICVNSSCYGSTAAGLHVRDVTMNMSDDVGPAVSFSQSSELLDGQIQRGTGRISIASADVGAGLTSVWVLVNEQEIARQNYPCTGSPMQPCPSNGGTLNFAFDTQGLPFHDGENTLQACAADYGAPPNVTCTAERTIHVDNSCTASGVPGGANLSAEFPRSDSDAVNVKAGQGALLTGRLIDNSGNPVERATLCMKEGIAGEGLDEVGTVRTDSDGHYRFSVSPGPNRRLLVGYRYNRHQLERDARFFSRLQPRLKLSPKRRTKNGELLRLYGSIPGPSNDDRVVILQAGYPHSKQWKTFAKAKTGPDGRYLARYRFTATFATTTYAMRSLVPEQNGYPYQGGASRTKMIKVVGGASRR